MTGPAVELSPQEFRVARQAVQSSRTQRQIGAGLGLSEDAVRQTLKRVYRKFGVQSRLQLRDVWAAR